MFRSAIMFCLLLVFTHPVYADTPLNQVNPTKHPAISDQGILKSGMYAEIGSHVDHGAITGEIGYSAYLTSNLSARAGAAFLASEILQRYYGGVNLGIRYGIGDKFAPFIGMGVFLGSHRDPDTGIVEDMVASWYPEAGINYWIAESTRLTIFGKYYYMSAGRGYDHAVVGLGIGFYF